MINTLLELRNFEDNCLGFGPGPQVWCYDFDGVVHTKMKPGQSLRNPDRDPDKDWLKYNFTYDKWHRLLPYLFAETINHMRYGQSIGAKIKIVSANSDTYKIPILNILNHVGINIQYDDIHMGQRNKHDKLNELKCTLFMDDSCDNIKKIYVNKKIIRTLQKLVFVVPEQEKEYKSNTHYEIDLNKNLSICDSSSWAKDLLDGKSINGIKLLEYPKNKHTFNLTSWNIYYAIMTEPYRLNLIKDYLSQSYRKPDILFIQESHFDLGSNYKNYEKIVWSSPKKSAICIYFNKKIFSLNGKIAKLGFNNDSDVQDYLKFDDTYNDNSGNNNRPILGVKLKHIETSKDIIFVNLWAPHHVNKKRTGKFRRFLSGINNVINKLYTGSERVILAGDFNEFLEYSNNKTGFNVNILNLNKGELNKVDLYLKQRNNTCCGSTKMTRSGGLFEGANATRPFDLYYDSDPVGSAVRVGTSKISDHLPISAIVTV